MAAVRLSSIDKTFGSTAVLQNIDLTVNDRELLVLVGPSGCGKSTLLRLVAGLEHPTGGTVTIGDRPVNHLPPKERDVAMVFQNYALYPHLSVRQNLAFGLKRQGTRTLNPFSATSQKRRQVVTQRVQTVAQQLQLGPLLNRKPKELSGGQKQRVALGRAMARDPQVFLLDEPLSNLDAQLRGETRAQIVQLQRQLQVTTLYVTHDRIEAMTMGDRIAVLNGGILQQVDTPLNLYRYPANQFVACFLGSPPMNLLPVSINTDGQITGAAFSTPLQLDQPCTHRQSLLLGCRPEHLSPAQPGTGNITGTVELVEILGDRTLVTVTVNDTSFQASVPPELGYRVGESTSWSLDARRIYLFDADTQNTLLYPSIWPGHASP